MAELLAVALAGTAAAGEANSETSTPVDALMTGTTRSGGAERRLLLAAGAEAVYRQAGYVAAQASEPPIPAPEETLPVCSPTAALLLRLVVVGQHEDLLPEALDRLRCAGLRLPFELLPLALGRSEPELRAALLPVLGERGRWLSGFNRRWAWAGETPTGGAVDMLEDAEAIWQEGSAGQRIALLRRLRAVDAARAREWVATVWKQEKADFRQDMLRALAVGLETGDEPLIEAALDDRAAGVRAEAADLLAGLSASAYVARMTARADALLALGADGKLDARPPKALPDGVARDGIAEKPPQGTGARAFWLGQILARVPPSHWSDRFEQPPDVLIAAAASSSWRAALLEGWTRAAARFGARDWALAVWSAWRAAPPKERQTHALEDDDELRQAIAHLLPPDALERAATEALAQAVEDDETALDEGLALLPVPWSVELGAAYLRGLRAQCERLTKTSREVGAYAETLDRAAHALPQSCFGAALEPLPVPEDASHWKIKQLRQQLDDLAETIRQRMRLVAAIPIPDEQA